MMYPRKTYHTVFFGFLFVAIFGFALPVLAEQSGTDPAENGSDDSRTKTEENFFFSDDADCCGITPRPLRKAALFTTNRATARFTWPADP